jgi:arginine utilization protein RocB
MMQQTLDFLNFDKPVVIFGFAPPYYPAVRSEDIRDAERFEVYKKALSASQDIEIRTYFPGVSDCSYCGLSDNTQSSVYQANTPLWGTDYRFDMEVLARLQIPFFLFGPWGKDLHQIGERVNRHSLTEEYPEVLRKLLQCVWLSE